MSIFFTNRIKAGLKTNLGVNSTHAFINFVHHRYYSRSHDRCDCWRDILLGHYPLGWVAHPQYLVITCLAGLLTTVMAKWVVRFHKLFIILDAIGLIVF